MVLIFVLMNRCYLFNRWFNQSETRMRRVYNKRWLEIDLSGTMTVSEFDQSEAILQKSDHSEAILLKQSMRLTNQEQSYQR